MTIPSDAVLQDWLKSQHLELIYGPPNAEGTRLCGVLVPSILYVIVSASTWQAAVIEAIKRDGSRKSLSLLGL